MSRVLGSRHGIRTGIEVSLLDESIAIALGYRHSCRCISQSRSSSNADFPVRRSRSNPTIDLQLYSSRLGSPASGQAARRPLPLIKSAFVEIEGYDGLCEIAYSA